jgi:hypothetical protein
MPDVPPAGFLPAAHPGTPEEGIPMSKQKLTRAEAGRLGGLKTKQRHGSEHFRRAGHLGAQATLDRHGAQHMAAIGRKGFSALAGKIGCYRSRRAAVEFLQAKGRLTVFPIEAVVTALAAIPTGPDGHDPEEENAVIAAILVSIRSAPIPEGGGL